MKILSLTSSEEQLMLVIWGLDSAYMKDIMTAYPEPKPHQNTVSTFLKILVEKNYLSIEKKGRIFKYIPKIKFEDYRKFQLENLLDLFYNNDERLLLKDLNISVATTFKIEEAPKEEKSLAEVIEDSLDENAKTKDNMSSEVEKHTIEKNSKKKEKKEKKDKDKKKKKHKKSDS
ncbi:BlaI/MecI/CopY family transcriptional regulator [Soonwooa purpurea]